ncbi:MAG TPA: VOC family protein [Caulobacteraceae bacterium]|nr:VOC family protein [Caulobacteraceae bacterium]
MTIRGIDHVNIGTHRLEETRAFFRDVLGLAEGWRPDFGFGGAWLYAGDGAVVHLVELAEPKRPSSEAALDHFAFRIDDYEGVAGRLDAAGVPYRAIDIADTPIRQIFIRDLNGVNIELNYRPATAHDANPEGA